MENKDEFLKNLACFGCEYRDECYDDWSETEQCLDKMQDAITFCDDNGLMF